jgi:hypothetical protein
MALYKITLSGNETPVDGCESMTEEQMLEWINSNQEMYEEINEHGDYAKYIVVPLEV